MSACTSNTALVCARARGVAMLAMLSVDQNSHPGDLDYFCCLRSYRRGVPLPTCAKSGLSSHTSPHYTAVLPRFRRRRPSLKSKSSDSRCQEHHDDVG